ncbi:protein ORF113 [Cyprinid herpesvirus 3]|nr:protein ORF113 [Cyprinid herpesvirus 3]
MATSTTSSSSSSSSSSATTTSPDPEERSVPTGMLLFVPESLQFGLSINPHAVVTANITCDCKGKRFLLISVVKPEQFFSGGNRVCMFPVQWPENMRHRISVMCKHVYECPPWSPVLFFEALLSSAPFPPSKGPDDGEDVLELEINFQRFCVLGSGGSSSSLCSTSASTITPTVSFSEPPRPKQQPQQKPKPSPSTSGPSPASLAATSITSVSASTEKKPPSYAAAVTPKQSQQQLPTLNQQFNPPVYFDGAVPPQPQPSFVMQQPEFVFVDPSGVPINMPVFVDPTQQQFIDPQFMVAGPVAHPQLGAPVSASTPHHHGGHHHLQQHGNHVAPRHQQQQRGGGGRGAGGPGRGSPGGGFRGRGGPGGVSRGRGGPGRGGGFVTGNSVKQGSGASGTL